jgi:hypothetical protein
MSYTPINTSVYLAAFDAIAGFYDAQLIAPVDYADMALAWAQAVDVAWGSGTPTTLELALIGSCSIVQWQGQAPATDGSRYSPTAYKAWAENVVALAAEGNAAVASQGINPSAVPAQYVAYYDARAWGCVLDGVTDDTVDLQKAINYVAGKGGTLLLSGTAAVSSQVTIGGAGNPVAGFSMVGPVRATNQHVDGGGLRWIGPVSASPMLYIRNAYGGQLANLYFSGSGKVAYGLQFEQVIGDSNVVEHWMVDRCFFADATVYNTLIGSTNAATSNGDVSAVEFHNCLWQRSFLTPATQTIAHVAHQASNALANCWYTCQFDGGWNTLYNVMITTGRCDFFGCLDTGSGQVPQGATTWAPSTTPALGHAVTPTQANANGYYFEATTVTGPTGLVEPVWPTTIGNTVVDNDVVWTCTGIAGSSFYLPTVNGQIPGGLGIYGYESQAANFIQVLPAGVATAQFPVTICGLHHGDIYQIGAYTINWNRGYYGSLSLVGGNYGHGIVVTSTKNVVNLCGPTMASANGVVRGAGIAHITGWWTIDGNLYSQVPNLPRGHQQNNINNISSFNQYESATYPVSSGGGFIDFADNQVIGMILITDQASNLSAMYALHGTAGSVTRLLNDGGAWGTTLGTPGLFNLNWNAGTGMFRLENDTVSNATFMLTFIGFGGH